MGGSVSMIDGHIDEVLKSCPFCGGAACKFVNLPLHGEKTKWGISCMVCYAKTQPRETIEEAIKAWNRRADNG